MHLRLQNVVIFGAVAALLVSLPTADALSADPPPRKPGLVNPNDQQYRTCLAQVDRKPDDAFEEALAWRDRGGGFPAKHCVAMALVALKQYVDAAARLERLAEEMRAAGDRLLPDVLGQAGNAWLLAGQNERALGVFTAALGLQPNNPDLLIDHARAAALQQDFMLSLTDLDKALAFDPDRADALAYRASAKRQLGDAPGALKDVDRAIRLDPHEIEAYLERGILRAAAGDTKGAREDWLKVAVEAPGTPAAESAQRNIEKMDLQQK